MAADALSRLGYAVTIMDNPHAPGGRLVNGLAGFKVDRAVIRRRVQSLSNAASNSAWASRAGGI